MIAPYLPMIFPSLTNDSRLWTEKTTGPASPMQQLDEKDRIGLMCGHTVSSESRSCMLLNSNLIRTRGSGKRKALEHKSRSESYTVSRKKNKSDICKEQMIPCWAERRQTVVLIPASAVDEFYKPSGPLIPLEQNHHQPMGSKVNNNNFGEIIFPISPDHTITLLQFNVIRGLLTVRHLLSPIFPPQISQGNECSTAAYHVLPDLSS
jgi:hypothetical protein